MRRSGDEAGIHRLNLLFRIVKSPECGSSGLFKFWFRSDLLRFGRCELRRLGDKLSETDDPLFPITFEGRIRDPLAGRRVIKTIGIRDDADMPEAVEENECSKPVFLVAFDRDRSSSLPLEIRQVGTIWHATLSASKGGNARTSPAASRTSTPASTTP